MLKDYISTNCIRPLICALALLIASIAGCADEKVVGNGLVDPVDTTDYSAVFTDTINDSVNDLRLLPPEQGAPPYAEAYDLPYVDVTRILLGIDGIYLYLKVEFRGAIPTGEVPIMASGEVEAQIVTNQGMNVALNTDNNRETGGGGEGVQGIDIFFAVSFNYGASNDIYCNYDFATNDVHDHQQQVTGKLLQGGPGSNFALVRYDISGLGEFFPRGTTVELGEWSEAESYNADGTLKYHHFAFDPIDQGVTWTIPAE